MALWKLFKHSCIKPFRNRKTASNFKKLVRYFHCSTYSILYMFNSKFYMYLSIHISVFYLEHFIRTQNYNLNNFFISTKYHLVLCNKYARTQFFFFFFEEITVKCYNWFEWVNVNVCKIIHCLYRTSIWVDCFFIIIFFFRRRRYLEITGRSQ